MSDPSGDRSRFFPAIEKKHAQPMSVWFDLLTEHGDATYAEQIALLREDHGFSQAHANAVVMHFRGSLSSKRFSSPAQYFAQLGEPRAATAVAIFAAITDRHPGLDLVMAWNQPMLRRGDDYVFAVSAAAKHLTISPWSDRVFGKYTGTLREAGLRVNKKTFVVPADWKVDADLLCAMVADRLAELDDE